MKNNQTVKPQDKQPTKLPQETQKSTIKKLSLSELDDNKVSGGLGYGSWW